MLLVSVICALKDMKKLMMCLKNWIKERQFYYYTKNQDDNNYKHGVFKEYIIS